MDNAYLQMTLHCIMAMLRISLTDVMVSIYLINETINYVFIPTFIMSCLLFGFVYYCSLGLASCIQHGQPHRLGLWINYIENAWKPQT